MRCHLVQSLYLLHVSVTSFANPLILSTIVSSKHPLPPSPPLSSSWLRWILPLLVLPPVFLRAFFSPSCRAVVDLVIPLHHPCVSHGIYQLVYTLFFSFRALCQQGGADSETLIEVDCRPWNRRMRLNKIFSQGCVERSRPRSSPPHEFSEDQSLREPPVCIVV